MTEEKNDKSEKRGTEFTLEVENRFGYRPPRAEASKNTEEKGHVPPRQERHPTSSDPKPPSSATKTGDTKSDSK